MQLQHAVTMDLSKIKNNLVKSVGTGEVGFIFNNLTTFLYLSMHLFCLHAGHAHDQMMTFNHMLKNVCHIRGVVLYAVPSFCCHHFLLNIR